MCAHHGIRIVDAIGVILPSDERMVERDRKANNDHSPDRVDNGKLGDVSGTPLQVDERNALRAPDEFACRRLAEVPGSVDGIAPQEAQLQVLAIRRDGGNRPGLGPGDSPAALPSAIGPTFARERKYEYALAAATTSHVIKLECKRPIMASVRKRQADAVTKQIVHVVEIHRNSIIQHERHLVLRH